MTNELTTPVPFAALIVISVLPKKMYLVEMMVLARPSDVMMNSAPSVPYVMLVPDSAEKYSLSPAVKSIMTVLPRAGSLGQAMRV